jgi:hypothetical protein
MIGIWKGVSKVWESMVMMKLLKSLTNSSLSFKENQRKSAREREREREIFILGLVKWLIVISQMIGTNKTAEEVREKIKKQKEREKERKGLLSNNGGAFSWLEKPQSYMNA